MLIQNVIPHAIDSFSKLINLDIDSIDIYFDNNEYLDYIAKQSDNSIRFNLCKIVEYLYDTKRLESEEEVRAFILRIVGHELCHINQLMVGNIYIVCLKTMLYVSRGRFHIIRLCLLSSQWLSINDSLLMKMRSLLLILRILNSMRSRVN